MRMLPFLGSVQGLQWARKKHFTTKGLHCIYWFWEWEASGFRKFQNRVNFLEIDLKGGNALMCFSNQEWLPQQLRKRGYL